MGRTKGDGLGRLGGRAKGTPNKVTAEMRKMISAFTEDNFKEFCDDWKKIMDKEKKCNIYLNMLKFTLPTLSSVSLEEGEKKDSVSDMLRQMQESYDDGDKKEG